MFELSKWYFDCVTDSGDTAIMYRVSVKWGLLHLNYAASLYVSAKGKSMSFDTLRPGADPTIDKSGIIWECPKLDISGIWPIHSPVFRCRLLDEPNGRIHWHCLSPGSNAEIRIGDERLTGTGYVEYLNMTVRPWQLPFSELKWGRFIAQTESLIWIQWLGPTPRTWLWLNGVGQSNSKITEERIELPDEGIVLKLRNESVLRSGPLDSTALRSVRALTRLIPKWKSAHETKWLARGKLSRHNKSLTGWVIHEVVRWL
ncbi:MAG: hypothetical protein GY935_08235 [Gammaproteobacteria bacterium]|nr:hypothetical protein [Gammaproteobacteria bacterium]